MFFEKKLLPRKQSKTEKGLEISTLAIVDLNYNTAYNLSTRQTSVLESPFQANVFENQKHLPENETRIDWYLDHFKTDCHLIPESVKYLLTDGYYSKSKFTNGILKLGYNQVSKLRNDANLRYLYAGKQKAGPGRKKLYDGKISFDDVSRMTNIKIDENLSIYTDIVNSVNLKCNIRIAYLVKKSAKNISTALLFSTDTDLSALQIYQYYKSRFQIEFIFRIYWFNTMLSSL